jgi:hypothetical protein
MSDAETLSPPLFPEDPPWPVCEHCQAPFEPRARSGGKPQRFCSTACRRVFHANVPNVAPTLADVGTSKPTLGTTDDADPPDWKWWDENNEDVLLQEQPRTAIYWNTTDSIVIRQENPWSDDGNDVVVRITRGNVRSLINRLIEMDRS